MIKRQVLLIYIYVFYNNIKVCIYHIVLKNLNIQQKYIYIYIYILTILLFIY
jgi:hypothetical protein